MLDRFHSFVAGIAECHRYIQRIKSAEMTEFGLKGTHVMCIFFLNRSADGLTAAQLSQQCGEDKAAISRTVAELERDYLLQRQREGIAAAKMQGKYTGRKPKVHPDQKRILQRWRAKEITATTAMKSLGISKTTFYRLVQKESV